MLRNLGLNAVEKRPNDAPEIGQAEGRFQELGLNRSLHVSEGEMLSRLTIPYLIRADGQNGIVDRPYHNAGFEGVSHLSSKFTTSLFPPEASFFRFDVNKLAVRRYEAERAAVLEANKEQVPESQVEEIEAGVAELEINVMREFQVLDIRSKFTRAFQHLLIGGNALLEINEEGSRVYGLESYALKRNAMGRVEELIIREKLDDTWLYTRVIWSYKERISYWWQEKGSELVEGSKGESPIGGCPWIPMRFEDSGYDYSWPFAEIALSDLVILNVMTRALSEGYVETARLIRLIKPGSQFRPTQARDARNGTYLIGDPDSITTVQGGKNADLASVVNYLLHLEQRIQRIFGMPISVQRRGERVSATEFQRLAESLEAASTGFFSVFSSEVQPLIVTRIMHILARRGLINNQFLGYNDGNELLGITPITGLEALGRESDAARILRFMESMNATVGPETMAKHVRMSKIIDRFATAMGVNSDGLIIPDEEIQAQEQANAQAAQAAQEQEMEAKTEQAIIQSPALGQAVKNVAEAAPAQPPV